MADEICNARIEKVSFGYEDHGFLTFFLGLDIAGGGGCCWGGYCLDEYDKAQGRRIPTQAGFECLTEIMKTVGVDNWEDLEGKYIRVVNRGIGRTIKTIGNLMEDKWFDIEEFFKNEEE